MRILLVEDNDRLADLISKGLKAGGFAVDSFPTLADADAALASVDYQAVILDLGLPDICSRNCGNAEAVCPSWC